MRSRMEDLEARLGPGRFPLVDLTVVLAATGMLWAICLPTMPTYLAGITELSTVFRPEALVLATLLALPLRRIAAWRAWVGLLALALMAAMSLAITDEAIDRVQAARLDLGGWESVWMPLAYVQVAIFVLAACSGFRQRRFVRRWHRLHRRLAANQPSSVPRSTSR